MLDEAQEVLGVHASRVVHVRVDLGVVKEYVVGQYNTYSRHVAPRDTMLRVCKLAQVLLSPPSPTPHKTLSLIIWVYLAHVVEISMRNFLFTRE